MRKLVATAAVVVAGLSLFAAAAPASAAPAARGTVTVFSTEFSELTVWEDPTGCHRLPVAAHVLTNQTDQPVRIHADPFCLTPDLTVEPGYGSHVTPGSGSFSVGS